MRYGRYPAPGSVREDHRRAAGGNHARTTLIMGFPVGQRMVVLLRVDKDTDSRAALVA